MWISKLKKFVKACKAEGISSDVIRYQWELFKSGVRDVRLHDMAIILIDEFGMDYRAWPW